MKITAYICDLCKKTYLEDDSTGVRVIQPTLFHNSLKFELVSKRIFDYDIHFCIHCYNESVIKVMDAIERNGVKRDSNKYARLVDDYTQAFLLKVYKASKHGL